MLLWQELHYFVHQFSCCGNWHISVLKILGVLRTGHKSLLVSFSQIIIVTVLSFIMKVLPLKTFLAVNSLKEGHP